MGWLDWAVNDPAPAENAGYSGLQVPPEVDASQKSGVVFHSAAGNWNPPGYKPSDLMRSRGNSWDATIMLNGEVWGHRPRPTFVNWHAGGPAQNIPLCGFEVEGTGPWAAAQKVSIVRVIKETWAYFGWTRFVMAAPTNKSQEGIRQAIVTVGKGSAYEHNWLDYTTCPNGRDDWAWLTPAATAAIAQEADMALDPNTDAAAFYQMLQTFLYSQDPAHKNVALALVTAERYKEIKAVSDALAAHIANHPAGVKHSHALSATISGKTELA